MQPYRNSYLPYLKYNFFFQGEAFFVIYPYVAIE